jgi:hypothetical protein
VLVLGAVCTGFGALCLLVLAIATGVLAGGILVLPGEDRSGDALAPALGAGVLGIAFLMLVVSLGLLVAGRDAGRSASAWIGASVLPPVAIAVLALGTALSSTDDRVEALATPALVGMCGGAASIVGFVVGSALLGSRAARRYLAVRLLTGAAQRQPASQLLRTALRYLAVAYGVALVGLGVFVVSARLSGADGSAAADRVVFLVVFGVLGLVLVLTGLAVIGGAAAAGTGRRGGATLARCGGAIALPVLWLLLFAVAVPAVALADSDTTALNVSAALGLFNAVLVIAAIAAMVRGLAALANPWSEHHFATRPPR